MKMIERITNRLSISSLIGWIGIIILGIVKEFVPSLSFLTTGFVGLIFVILFLSLAAIPFFKKKRYNHN